MKIRYIVYAALALVLGYLIYNRIAKGKESKSNQANAASGKGVSAPAANVNGIIVKTEIFSNSVSVSGTIEANEQVAIRSEISGLIRSINFTEGTNVSKGSVLIKIDDRELQAQLAQALTREKLAGENASRSAKLLKSEAISAEENDNIKAEYQALQAQTQLIRAQLSKTIVIAPFSGKIGLRSISSGAYVTPTTDIANLVNTNPVKISFSIPEKYAQRVKAGSNVTFTVAGFSKTFNASVYAVEPAVNITTRSLVLRAKANNPKGELIPGTFANVNLPLEEIKDAILIPSQAVVPVIKGKQVYISKDGKAKAVMITSDLRTDKNVLVLSGLKAGDTVLTTGVMALKPDAPVKVKITGKN